MRYLIAGHGDYAQGVVNTLKFFKDDLNNVDLLPYNNDFEQQLQAYLDNGTQRSRCQIVTDLVGGSVNLEAMRQLRTWDFYLISGVKYFIVIGNVVFRSERLSADRGDCKRGEGSDGLRQRHDGSAV